MAFQNGQNSLNIGSFIFNSLKNIGGYQIFTYNLVRRLSLRGHDVDLYIPAHEFHRDAAFHQSLPFSVRPALYQTERLARYLPGVLQTYFSWVNYYRDYDLWQVIGAYPAGYLLSGLSDATPVVLRTHGSDIQKDRSLEYGRRLDPEMERVIRETLECMTYLIALTESVTSCYEDLGIDRAKISEIPNGVNLERFSNEEGVRETVEKWNLPEEDPILLTVGRNHIKKGFDLIPDIARTLRSRGFSFHWVVVGEGAEELQPDLDTRNLRDSFQLINGIGSSEVTDHTSLSRLPDRELINLYQASDLLVFPSRLETFGRVLIEAMAAGLPVVTTEAPGCRDVVKHEVTGLKAQVDHVDELSECILRFIQNDDLRNEIIHNSREYVKTFSWEHVVDSYEELYYALLNGTR